MTCSITMLLTELGAGAAGVGSAAAGLARTLAGEGLRVVAAGTVAPGDDRLDEEWAGCELLPIRISSWRRSVPGSPPPQLRETATNGVIHAHGCWQFPSRWAAELQQRTGVPAIIAPHGMLDAWALRHNRWRKRLFAALWERPSLRRARCTQALTESEVTDLRRFGVTGPVALLPNGVELPLHAPSTPYPWPAKVAGRRVLLFLGRLHEKKNPLPLLAAWEALLKERPNVADDWFLALVGPAEPKTTATIDDILQKPSLSAHATRLPAVAGEQRDAALAAASMFILPSSSEGLPMTVLEAWAQGTGACISPACNLPLGIQHGAAVACGSDAASILGTLREVTSLTDEDLSEMGTRARELVEQRFSLARVAEDARTLYTWLLGGGPAPAFVESR